MAEGVNNLTYLQQVDFYNKVLDGAKAVTELNKREQLELMRQAWALAQSTLSESQFTQAQVVEFGTGAEQVESKETTKEVKKIVRGELGNLFNE